MNALAKYLPFILQSIVAVQAAIPTAPGKTKKEIVLGIATAAASAAQAFPNDHVAQAGAVADATVQALQKTGLLVKDQAPGATGGKAQ